MPPDVLACGYMPLRSETLGQGTAEREMTQYTIACERTKHHSTLSCFCTLTSIPDLREPRYHNVLRCAKFFRIYYIKPEYTVIGIRCTSIYDNILW